MRKPCVDCGIEPKAKKDSRCVECRKANRRADYKSGGDTFEQAKAQFQRGREFMDIIKGLPCQDCGGKFPPECMDFDHRDPELKSFQVQSQRVGKTWETLRKLMLEVSKCDLVCSNCHRIRTRKQVESGSITLNRKYDRRFAE